MVGPIVLILLLLDMARAADLNFHDAVHKTKELQKKERERRRKKEAKDDIWDKHFNESTTGGKYSFNRTVEATEWILTGTSPILEKSTEAPKRGSLLATKQPPYVHWVCYRGVAATNSSTTEQTAEKLACCLEIYRAMLQDPEGLCWNTDLEACGYNPNQLDPQNLKIDLLANLNEKKQAIAAARKTEFMQHCTHLLTPLPTAILDHRYARDGRISLPPRWSLLQSPSVLQHKPTKQWRQFVQDSVSGIWIKRSDLSPIHVTRPIRLNATTPYEVTDTFPVFYTTQMVASHSNDEWRIMEHTLQLGVIDDPPSSLSAQVILLLFLPNELRPINQLHCTPDCHVSMIADTWSTEKTSVWGQPSVVALQVDIPQVTTKKHTWTTTLRLEDEESLIVSPPLIYSAVMTSPEDNRVWVWDGNVRPNLSLLLTDLEEKERLQDLWKVEL
jgi:hypothetical protein